MRNPAGAAPFVHVYGAVPPVATSALRTGTPTSATRRDRLAEIEPTTLSVNCRESTRVPAAAGSVETAVPFTVKVADPAAVGVPEIVPSFDSASPAGSEPSVVSHVTLDEMPLPSSLAEYGEPIEPDGSDSVEIPHRRT